MTIYLSAISQGFLWGIMGIGLYITFRILRFADLTAEASFTMGAAIAVSLAVEGVHPMIATLSAVLGGMGAGLITGFLMTYFDIPSLLAGIITLTAFYSINLRVMGKPNLSLRNVSTLFQSISKWVTTPIAQRSFIGILFLVIMISLLGLFFKTDLGQAVIATGDNEVMAYSLGINTKGMKIFALVLSNGIIGMSGALVAQDNGVADISMGSGTVVIALSAIVIGEILFKNATLIQRLVAIVIGAVVYRIILVLVLQLGFNANDFRLISATILALFLAVPALQQRLKGGASNV